MIAFHIKKHTGFSTMTTSQQNILGKFIKTNTEKIVKNSISRNFSISLKKKN